MKRKLYLFIAFVLPALCFADTRADKLFAAGNAYYAKGKYKAASATYQQILNTGYQSAALYYNLGNASYKNDEIPAAILYYEKAKKLAPGDEDININIRFANLKTADKIDDAPEFVINRWWHTFILHFSINMLAIFSVALMLIGSALLIGYFFGTSVVLKKIAFFGAMVLFLLGLFTIFVASSQERYFRNHQQAIIFTNTVTVKSGPGLKAASLFVLHEGTKVNTFENRNGWTKVKLVNGNEGWIKAADLRAI